MAQFRRGQSTHSKESATPPVQEMTLLCGNDGGHRPPGSGGELIGSKGSATPPVQKIASLCGNDGGQRPPGSERVKYILYYWRLVLLAWLLVAFVACSSPASNSTTTAATPASPQSGASPTAGQSEEAATPALLPQAGLTGTPAAAVADPVLSSDFPDPDVLAAAGAYYAYATNANGKNIQVARSADLQNWELLPKDALPALPTWAQPGGSLVWAPGVIQAGQRFVMYYTARDMASNKQCIGVAVSDRPEGKYRDTSEHPIVCQADLGGSIDPDPFPDGGKLYLYWKNDGNCCGMPTSLWVQELAADGLSLTGQPQKLTDNSQPWEGNLVEAPFMYRHNGRYYLFFSANDYASQNYAVGYATCASATGPCQQAADNPILKSRLAQPLVIGPGGESLLDANGRTWMFFHAWDVVGGTRGDARYMWMAPVEWQNDKPVVEVP